MVLGKGTIWAGSAGLARHVANAAGLHADGCHWPSVAVSEPRVQGPLLFVVGSQAKCIARTSGCRLRHAGGWLVIESQLSQCVQGNSRWNKP